jgi:hypothetical protein
MDLEESKENEIRLNQRGSKDDFHEEEDESPSKIARKKTKKKRINFFIRTWTP